MAGTLKTKAEGRAELEENKEEEERDEEGKY